jgi:pimeloyl-ACP methyl ester carboxylesterase
MASSIQGAVKTPLILLPGLMCDRTVWDAVPGLSDIAECLVVEHGNRNSIAAMAQAVLEQAPERFALAGHSMGGRIALEVYRRASGRVLALALLDTGYQARAAGAAGEEERAGRYALLELAKRSGMRAMGVQWVRRMVHPERLADDALIEAILAMIERHTTAIFEAQITALLDRPDASSLLQEIACPTLVLCGREDGWSPLARHMTMAQTIPGAELVVIERSGHMSTMEQPDAVGIALRRWLKRARP